MTNNPSIFLPYFQQLPQTPRSQRARPALPSSRKDTPNHGVTSADQGQQGQLETLYRPPLRRGQGPLLPQRYFPCLSAADVIVFPGEEQAFVDLRTGLIQDLRPVGAHQLEVFDQLVYHAWNRRRVRGLIAGMARALGFDPAASPFADPRVTPEIAAEYERLSRYHRHHNAGYSRCIRDLRIAQTELAVRLAVSPATAAAIPPLATTSELTNRTQIPGRPHEILVGLTGTCTRLGMDSTAFAPHDALK